MTVDPDDLGAARRRGLRLLPTLAFVATFGVFAVDKNREARTVLGSGRGLLVVAALVAGYAAVSLALRGTTRRPWAAPVVQAVVVLALATWIVLPYYVDETVERRLVADPVLPTQAPPATAPPASPPGPAGGEDANAGRPQSPPAPSDASVGRPLVVASAPLVGIGHRARGTASLVRAPDGSLVVRLGDFDVERVPDPRVHLVEGEDVRRAGGVSLGRLAGNRGAVLDIAVPAGSGAGRGWTVLIWCRAFAVPVANATFLAPSP